MWIARIRQNIAKENDMFDEKRDCNSCKHMRLGHRPTECKTASWDDERNCSNYEIKRMDSSTPLADALIEAGCL